MSEFNPDAHVMLQMEDGSERRLDRHNSALFTFVGKTALGEDRAARNHIFLLYERGEEEDDHGCYIFAQSPVFKELAGFMLQNDFPAHLNMNEVGETDESAYRQMIDQEVQRETDFDSIPDDWS